MLGSNYEPPSHNPRIGVGRIVRCVDASCEKANRIYRGAILIDAHEHRPLLSFETFFNIRVWFACFPPDSPHACICFSTAA